MNSQEPLQTYPDSPPLYVPPLVGMQAANARPFRRYVGSLDCFAAWATSQNFSPPPRQISCCNRENSQSRPIKLETADSHNVYPRNPTLVNNFELNVQNDRAAKH